MFFFVQGRNIMIQNSLQKLLTNQQLDFQDCLINLCIYSKLHRLSCCFEMMYYQLQSCNLVQLLIKYIAKTINAFNNPSFGLVTYKLVDFLQTINVLNTYQGIFYQGNFCLILLQTFGLFWRVEGHQDCSIMMMVYILIFKDIQIAYTNQKQCWCCC